MVALLDGAFAIPSPVLAESGAPSDPGPTPIFAFALVWPDETWLVDAGAGPCLGAEAGRLPAAMEAAGLAPVRVRHILLTHLHPDHVGGLTDSEGVARFPKAEVLLSRREHADWLDPAEPHGSDAAEVAAWAARAIAPYPVRLLDDAADLGRGVASLPAPGHRAGHLAFRLRGEGGALFAGDLLHIADWQLADPERALVWDAEPGAASHTRHRLLGLAADESLLLAGAHLAPSGLARVARAGAGFAVATA